MKYVTIRPVLGTKNDCPIDSLTLLKPLDQWGKYFATHDTGGQNFDLERDRDACCKAYGRAQWDNSANAQATKCLGLHELWDGTNREHFYFDNGKVYKFDASRDQNDVSGAVTFATDDKDLYSIIQYGDYMVFADRAEHTPYKIDHNDAAVSKLIASGTEYKFRYLLNAFNRVIGLYSDQSDGNIDIRWTNALAETTFPAANQLYKPGDPIMGAIQLGYNTVLIFGETDIYRLDYYGSQTPVFNLVRVVQHWGNAAPHGLVSDGSRIYFLDKDRGFCSVSLGEGMKVVSDDYRNTINRIPTTYYDLITGLFIPSTGEVAWNIPVDSDTTPTKIIYYNTRTGHWRHENKAARRLDLWKTFTSYTWNDLIIETDDVWPSTKAWSYYTSESKKMVFGNSDGHLYTHSSEGDNGSDWDGYRIEPILPLGNIEQFKRLLEIWLSLGEVQPHGLDFYWRGGDTVAEIEAQGWTLLGSISLNNPANAVLYLDKTARLHQLKWGTDNKSQPFDISAIKIGFVIQGKY